MIRSAKSLLRSVGRNEEELPNMSSSSNTKFGDFNYANCFEKTSKEETEIIRRAPSTVAAAASLCGLSDTGSVVKLRTEAERAKKIRQTKGSLLFRQIIAQ